MKRKVVIVVAAGLLALVVAWRLWPHREQAESATDHAATATGGAMHASARGVQAAPASLSGRVVRKSDKAGIEGAVVSLTHADLIAELATQSPTVVVASDATGAWTAKVPPGAYVVGATAPGLLPGKLPKLWLKPGEQRTDVVLVLEAGGTAVRGAVTDIGGGPIRGARVTVKQSNTFDWQQADYAAITAADGTYQLNLRDGVYEATADHDDYTRVE